MQQSSPVSHYSIAYQVPFDGENEKSLYLAKESGFTDKTSPEIYALVHQVCRSYVFSLKDDERLFSEGLNVRLRFSPQDGMNVLFTSDERIRSFIEKLSQTGAIPFSFTEAQEKSMLDLKRMTPTEEVRAEAQKTKGKKAVFIDPIALRLWRGGVKTAEELILRVQMIKSSAPSGGLATGHLRFPHLLFGIAVDFLEKDMDPIVQDLKVCLVGPGFSKEGRFGYCPQLVELRSLMPNARYMLLENDKTGLELLDRAINKIKMISYDFMMWRVRTVDKQLMVPEPLLTTLRALIEEFAQQVIQPKNPLPMLQGGKLEELVVKLDPEKIQLRDFDILSSHFKDSDKGQFDVVVATMSLSNALQLDSTKKTALDDFRCIGKFVELLKPKGVLYCDSLLMHYLSAHYGDEVIKIGVSYLEAHIGYRIKEYTYPLKLVDAKEHNFFSVFPNYSYKCEKHTISTASIDCYQLTTEKIKKTPEERRQVAEKLEKLVRK